MNLLNGKKFVKHHSKNLKENASFLVPACTQTNEEKKDCIFILMKDFTVIFFSFFKEVFLLHVIWALNHTSSETESWSSCFKSYVYSIYFRTIKIQICDKGLKVKNVP